MANDRQTTNYLDLILPKGPEYYSVQDGNTNFTILDTKIEEIVNSITSLNININSTIEKVVADLIGGATEGIDSLKDILDLLNDPESGELVKINEAINQRLTIESFDQFKTEHTRVHDTVNGRLTAIDDPVTGSVAVEQTARIAADEALDEKIGSLELLKTTNKEDIINAINEIVGNIGALTSLKTSVKTSIVNAINSNKESIDALTTDTSDYNNKNGFYFYNLKNVLIKKPSLIASRMDTNTYSINLSGTKLLYYGRIIDINQDYTLVLPTNTSNPVSIYIGMVISETDYGSEPSDIGYVIKNYSSTDLVISPTNWIIGDDNGKYTSNNKGMITNLPDDKIEYGRVVFKQVLCKVYHTTGQNAVVTSVEWANSAELPTLDYTNYYDYVNGIYRLVEENLGDTINSKIDNINSEIDDIKLDIGNINDSYTEKINELNEIVGKSNSHGGFTGGSSTFATYGGAVGFNASTTYGGAVGNNASATYGGAIGSDASTTNGGAVGWNASATTGGGAVGWNASVTYGGAAVGNNASATSGAAIGSGVSATSGGAVGSDAEETSGGFAGGASAHASNGGAVGSNALTISGGVVGNNASADYGGAVGSGATATSGGAVGADATATGGGAVGQNAKTGSGFAGGFNAKTQDYLSGDGIDAIQLGTGTNQMTKTLQVYTYQLMDESGNVPSARLTQAVNSMGSDFAESLEWLDGNPNNEDRRGLFVTLTSDENNEYNKIKLANSDDEIVGVVSSIPTVIGNSCNDNWKGKYQTDIFGKPLTQIVHHEAVYEDVEVRDKDEDGNLLKTTHTESVLVSEAYDTEEYILSSEYDPSQEYIPRLKRKEWASIGFIGQLIVVDDGTCIPGKKCKCGNNGVGTLSDNDIGYRVLSRIDDTHIKILLK